MPFDKSKFIDQFKSETREHLQKLNLGLLKLEKSNKDEELLNSLMREAHTIKGSGAMMGYKRISDIAHKIEDAFEKVIKEGLELGPEHFNVLFKGLDSIEPLLEDKVTWEDKGVARPFADNLCAEIEAVFSGKQLKKKPEKSEPAVKADIDAHEAAAGIKEGSVRVDIARLDKLMNLSGEQLVSKIRLNELIKSLTVKAESRPDMEESLGGLVKELNRVNNNIDFLSSNIQTEVMGIRMVPVAILFNTFPRAMRDLAHSKGVEINFELKGVETELDKSIVDQMKDPLMHILRNAIDHGIEPKEERMDRNKPQAGSVGLSAYQQGSQVVIEISDDGRGIDINKIKEEAISKKVIARDKIDLLAEDQIMQLIFTPGFTTKEEVTETSGRGVGLDVVRETVSRMKGMVEVASKLGEGTKFIIKLPLTLAITESLLIAAGDDVFAIPVERVVETIRVNPDDIKSVETKEAITVRGHILPLVRITDLFGLPKRGIVEKSFFPVVVVQSVEKRIGLLVDRLLGHQNIVGKALGDPLNKVRNIAGATILGSGRAILILDIASIIESAEGVIIRKTTFEAKHAVKGRRKKAILLAEDSMSTAMLEKNILESVGYSVVIARDGQEALERAGHEKFDLVITDILMPRMDGFELTTRLKKDKKYKDVPVIVVTTRESDADKKRGLEAGAEAYILKSEFTSDTLLDTIERLLG